MREAFVSTFFATSFCMDLAVTTVSINRFLISSSEESDESDDDVIVLKLKKNENFIHWANSPCNL